MPDKIKHVSISHDIPVHDLAEQSPDRQADKNFYSGKTWRNLRTYWLGLNPVCKLCGGLARDVDHVIDRKLLPQDQWYDTSNLQSLCRACHAKKRRQTGRIG